MLILVIIILYIALKDEEFLYNKYGHIVSLGYQIYFLIRPMCKPLAKQMSVDEDKAEDDRQNNTPHPVVDCIHGRG